MIQRPRWRVKWRVFDLEDAVEDQMSGTLTHRPRQKDQLRGYMTQSSRQKDQLRGYMTQKPR